MAVSATGKVTRLYTSTAGTYIRIAATPAPKYGYYLLKNNHPNYGGCYSLALVAATNGYNLRIRATTTITPSAIAQVSYLVVDW